MEQIQLTPGKQSFFKTYQHVRNTIRKSGAFKTERQIQIATWIFFGLNNIKIADTCCISVDTVKYHKTKMFKILGVKNRHGVKMFVENLLNMEEQNGQEKNTQ